MKTKHFVAFVVFSLVMVLIGLFLFFSTKKLINEISNIKINFKTEKEEFPYLDADFLIFENEEKNISFEFNNFKKEMFGIVRIVKGGKEEKYSCKFAFYNKEIHIYYDIYLNPNGKYWDHSTFILDIVVEKNKNDYNSLLLSVKEENDVFMIFSNNNIKLSRVYDKKINTIHLFFNVWQSSSHNFRFANYNSDFFKRHLIEGTINNELVTLRFYDDEFEIKNKDEKIILKGKYSISEYDIILNKEETFDEYPDEITLTYSRR